MNHHFIGQLFSNILTLTFFRLRARYRGTYAGFLWVILNPLLMFLAQALIFKNILKLDVAHYSLFLLSGLIPWIFITMTLQMGVNSVEENRSVIRTYNISPLATVVSYVLENLITFSLLFLLIFSFIALTEKDMLSFKNLLWLPLPYALTLLSTVFATFTLAILQVFHKDTKFLINFVISIGFFVTPIFYPIEFVPQQFRFLVELNPFHIAISPLRQCFYDFNLMSFSIGVSRLLLMSLILFVICYYLWKKKKYHLYHEL